MLETACQFLWVPFQTPSLNSDQLPAYSSHVEMFAPSMQISLYPWLSVSREKVACCFIRSHPGRTHLLSFHFVVPSIERHRALRMLYSCFNYGLNDTEYFIHLHFWFILCMHVSDAATPPLSTPSTHSLPSIWCVCS